MNPSRLRRQASVPDPDSPSISPAATGPGRSSRASRSPRFLRGRRPSFRLARLEAGRLQTSLRGAMIVTALALILHGLLAGGPLLALGGAAVAGMLLLLAEAAPISWTREGPLVLTGPVGFALTLWLGPVAAALGALLAWLLPARPGGKPGTRRGDIGSRGAPMALAAFAGSAAVVLSAHGLDLRLGTGSSLAAIAGGAPLAVLAAAVLGALVFSAASLLFGAGAHLDAVRTLWRAPRARAHFGSLALVTALGMLSVVLLAPFGAKWGLAVALPATALLLLCGQWARMTLEVSNLRGQLEAAEAMGRASVADPATDRDASLLLLRFLTLARSLVSAERAIVWTMDQETRELTPAASLPDMGLYAGQRALFGEGLIGHAAARQRPRLIADAGRDPRRGEREVAFGAWLLYPIVVHDRLLGVAQWIRPVSHPFTSEDVSRLASLVPQAAVALENLRIRETMHNLAATDGLTGLWNHRRMHDLLRDEMRRASRYLRPLSVLMLDVDSFKAFNDTYGHPQGDQLLRSIASILHANVRNVDFLGRYGGEEFLIVLPETAKDDACRLAERIRCAVEEQAFVIVEGEAIRRTVSVGVASYPEDALNPDELVQRADEALYRAKRAGKNRVLWA